MLLTQVEITIDHEMILILYAAHIIIFYVVVMSTIVASLQHKAVKDMVISLTGVMLLFACSQVNIPLQPVPITLQTIGVMLIALLYNKGNGLRAIFMYLLAGAVGIPVFSGYGSGFSVLSGPCCGYFFGFALCIYVMNLIKYRFGICGFINVTVNCAVGTVVIFVCGVSWLALSVGFKAAIEFGLLPFVIPGIIKMFLLSSFLSVVRSGE